MYAAMLGAHLLLAPGGTTSPAHSHPKGLSWIGLGMWGGLVLAGVEMVLVAIVLLTRSGTVAGPAPAPEPAHR
jgi:hypothetical protein